MAKAKRARELDFTPTRRSVEVDYEALRFEFDVRVGAEGATQDETAIEELVSQFLTTKITQHPLVTKDLVIIDGRHNAAAQHRIDLMTADDADENKPKGKIIVDVLGFTYDDCSEVEKDQCRSKALEMNLPKKGGSFRQYGSEEDIKLQIEKLILGSGVAEFGLSFVKDADAVAIQDYVSVTLNVGKGYITKLRFDKIYPVVVNKLEQKALSAAKGIKATNKKLSNEQIAEIVGLPERLIPSIEKGRHRPGKTLEALIKKQNHLNSALISLERYARNNKKDFKEGKLSGKTYNALTQYHVQTVQKILAKMERIVEAVQKLVAEQIADFHRI